VSQRFCTLNLERNSSKSLAKVFIGFSLRAVTGIRSMLCEIPS
jgi:hypothetical protein